MATEVKRRRGTTDQHFGGGIYSGFTGATAELTVNTEEWTVHVHDNSRLGGYPLLRADFNNVPTTAPFTHITLDTAIFDTSYTETGSETQGTLYWNSDEETISLVTNGESFELGQKTEIHVKNQTGAQINKGEVVYASGTVGNSGRILITKMIANGTVTAKRIMGVAAENIANGADGKIITFGKLKNINTSSFSDGDILYVSASTAGAFQNTEPSQASGHVSLPIAYVIHSHNNGQIFIRVTPIDENEYQDYDAGLTDIAGLTPSDGNFIVGNGTNFVAESGNTARTSLGLGTSDDVQFDDLTLSGVLRTNEIDTQADLVWNTSTEVWNTSDYYISGALNIAGSVYITDELDVAESVSIGTTLNVTGNTTISGTLDAPTLNTGQGDNELYAMNQDVQTTDGVIFDTLSVTNNASVGGSLTLTGEADFNSTMNLQGNLTTQANLQDDGYATGWSGTNWQIQADGSAELQELRVRGALRVFEFIAKQISTIGGSEILSIAQGRVVSVDSDNDTITVENVTGTAGNSFKVNDLFICQVTDINNDLESGGTGSIVKSVRGGVIDVTGNDIEVSITSGNLTDLVTGDLIVAYGNTTDADRQAIMYRNVDRSEDNLIMRLQTEVNAFSDLKNVANTRVAFGDLNGYSGLSSETFGFFAGKNAEGHILATDGGLFLKDGTNTLAEITSNTFKVGDSTNFLSFNGTTFDIQTDTFNLNTTNLDISSANQNIVIGTGSALMTVGKLSSAEQGIKIDSGGITNQNYWKLGQGDVQFKVGDGTNFLSFNENAGTFEINTDTFDLTAGNLRIKSAGTTYPSASANTEVTTSDVSDFRLATLANGFNTSSLAINNNRWVKFQFDYSQSVPAGSFTAGITVTLEVSTNNSTFTDYGLFSDTRIDFNTNYFVADNATGNRLNVVDQSDSTKTEFKFTSSQNGSCTGTITMYFYVNEKDSTTHIRFNVLDSSGVTLSGASATNIGTRDYNPVTELNPSGIFTRLSDSLILSNGNTYIDYSLIT